MAANPLPGFYERITAYGARDLQAPDPFTSVPGVHPPGSSPALLLPYAYLHSGLSRYYANDGLVPLASAQFDGAALWARAEAYGCDHRYIKRGYPEFVRGWTSSYTDWAFCAGTGNGASYATGRAGGYAVAGSIFGVPGGIVETVTAASQSERVLAWAEQAYAPWLQPAGAATDVWNGYYFRHYPATQSYVGVKDGAVYYQGPDTQHRIVFVARLADFLARAQAAGY